MTATRLARHLRSPLSILLVFAAVVVTLIWAVFVANAVSGRERTLAANRTETQRLAKVLAHRIWAGAQRRASFLISLGDAFRPQLLRGGPPTRTEVAEQQRLLASREGADARSIGNVAVIDRVGRTLLATDPSCATEAKTLLASQAAASQGETAVRFGRPIFCGSPQRLHVPLFVQINTDESTLLGAAILYYEHEDSRIDLADAKPGVTGVISVFSLDGIYLLREPFNAAALNSDRSASWFFQSRASRPRNGSVVLTPSVEGIERILSYYDMAELGIIVMVSLHMQEVLAPWREDTVRQAAALLVLTLFVVLMALLLFRQIKRREAMTLALEHSEEQLRRIADVAGDGYFTLDAAGSLAYLSPHFEQRTGVAPEELVRAVIAHLEDGAPGRSGFLTVAKPLPEATLALKSRRGTMERLRVCANVAIGDSGDIVGLNGIVTNVTEVESAKRLAEHRQKLATLGELAGGIAHDINNVLGAILGFTGLLKEDLRVGSAEHGYAGRIDMAATRAKEIVQQILLYTRASRAERQNVDVAPALVEAISLARATLPSSIAIQSDLPQPGAFVRCSAAHLAQIVLNLCTNARDALPDQVGHVQIAARVRGQDAGDDTPPPQFAPTDRPVEAADGFLCVRAGTIAGSRPFVELSVTDNGDGMSLDVLSRILDPFFTTKAAGKGTGLGVTVVLGIVMEWGGAMEIRTKQGKGTRVAIFLPLAEAPNVAVGDAGAVQEPGRTGMILLADDNRDMGDALSDGLRKSGHAVTCVTNGREALAAFSEAEDLWDLLVTDQVMPEIKGIDLIGAAKRRRPDMPCILMTGYSDSIDAQRAAEAGADLLLNKPFPIDELRRHINRLLAASRSDRQEADQDSAREADASAMSGA